MKKRVEVRDIRREKIKKVILVIADTLRAKSVGAYGANPSPTPTIDDIGKRGILFTNPYTSITKTDPSITAIMAGKYPMSTGLISHGRWLIKTQEQQLKEISFLAEVLQKKKLKTAAIDCFASSGCSFSSFRT